ncbi:MAG TPA: asparaginase domain-containing protein [Fibrobacteria bacterium]|nr:asparaginase domain-containing protein [Fibrobacteria bacterium]
MTRKVEVVYTGGTIGSQGSEGVLGTGSCPPSPLLEQTCMEDVVWSSSEPFRILSEDATPAHWTLLARHIAGLDLRSLDAVVVTHGSDTLAWTAKALSFALAGIPRPVVVVGSDKPLSDPSSNGPDNFRDAVAFALAESLPGVYVAWRNPGESTSIHLASRILPCDPYDDRFHSVHGWILGTMERGAFLRANFPENPSRGSLARSSRADLWDHSRKLARDGLSFDPKVLVLPAHPGADLAHIDPAAWRAIVQTAYHSGTAASQDGPGSLLDLSRRAASSGTPVFLGPCRDSQAVYESSLRLGHGGIRRAPPMESTSLVVKLQWLLGSGIPLSDLEHDLAWEILPKTIFQA